MVTLTIPDDCWDDLKLAARDCRFDPRHDIGGLHLRLFALGILWRRGDRDNQTDCEVHRIYTKQTGQTYEFHSSWYNDIDIFRLWKWAIDEGTQSASTGTAADPTRPA